MPVVGDLIDAALVGGCWEEMQPYAHKTRPGWMHPSAFQQFGGTKQFDTIRVSKHPDYPWTREVRFVTNEPYDTGVSIRADAPIHDVAGALGQGLHVRAGVPDEVSSYAGVMHAGQESFLASPKHGVAAIFKTSYGDRLARVFAGSADYSTFGAGLTARVNSDGKRVVQLENGYDVFVLSEKGFHYVRAGVSPLNYGIAGYRPTPPSFDSVQSDPGAPVYYTPEGYGVTGYVSLTFGTRTVTLRISRGLVIGASDSVDGDLVNGGGEIVQAGGGGGNPPIDGGTF